MPSTIKLLTGTELKGGSLSSFTLHHETVQLALSDNLQQLGQISSLRQSIGSPLSFHSANHRDLLVNNSNEYSREVSTRSIFDEKAFQPPPSMF